jgi:hypothetical protein
MRGIIDSEIRQGDLDTAMGLARLLPAGVDNGETMLEVADALFKARRLIEGRKMLEDALARRLNYAISAKRPEDHNYSLDLDWQFADTNRLLAKAYEDAHDYDAARAAAIRADLATYRRSPGGDLTSALAGVVDLDQELNALKLRAGDDAGSFSKGLATMADSWLHVLNHSRLMEVELDRQFAAVGASN